MVFISMKNSIMFFEIFCKGNASFSPHVCQWWEIIAYHQNIFPGHLVISGKNKVKALAGWLIFFEGIAARICESLYQRCSFLEMFPGLS